jgi:hypothetical protein
MTGEGTPFYLFHPKAAERIASYAPNAKILIVLRDPVERTLSHYNFSRTRLKRESRNLEQALDEEPPLGEIFRIIEDAERNLEQGTGPKRFYRATSEYAHQVKRFLELFPRNQIHISFMEELRDSPIQFYRDVESFLGLKPQSLEDEIRENTGKYVQRGDDETRRKLRRHFAPHNEELRRLIGKELPWPSAD